MYNQLSKNIKEKFQVIYSEHKPGGLVIFKSQNQKWGVIKNDSEILIAAQYESMQFEENKNWFIGVNFNKGNRDGNWSYYIHSVDGNLKYQTKKYNSIGIDSFGNIICKKGNEFGLLNDDLEEIISPKYKILNSLSKTLFQAKVAHKFGIIDFKEQIIHDFTISNVFGSFKNDLLVINENEQFYQIDSKGLQKNVLPYTHIIRAKSNTYLAPNMDDKNKFKIVANGTNKNKGYEIDDMFNISGNWGIIDEKGDVVIKPQYAFIDFFRSCKYYKVAEGKLEFDFNGDDKWIAKGVNWGIIGKGNTILIPLKYDWIEEISENTFAVNIGGTIFYNDNYQEDYWTVKGGRWGVLNIKNEEIVPIEYSSIMLNWFRVKDFVFVQKNTIRFNGELEYDVFDFQGNKIERNKPNYKEHRFY